jgi:hypothetical protein
MPEGKVSVSPDVSVDAQLEPGAQEAVMVKVRGWSTVAGSGLTVISRHAPPLHGDCAQEAQGTSIRTQATMATTISGLKAQLKSLLLRAMFAFSLAFLSDSRIISAVCWELIRIIPFF